MVIAILPEGTTAQKMANLNLSHIRLGVTFRRPRHFCRFVYSDWSCLSTRAHHTSPWQAYAGRSGLRMESQATVV